MEETDESKTRVDSPVPLMHHDPDRSWMTDPDPDRPKERTLRERKVEKKKFQHHKTSATNFTSS